METITPEAAGMAADLSVWALASEADMVVKLVMGVLLLASVWCWTTGAAAAE